MTRLIARAGALALALCATAIPASAGGRVEIGVLRCSVEGGVGLIVGSSKGMTCVFRHRGVDEHYRGNITKIGLDVGFTRRTEIAWAVLAATARVPSASLAGRYAGISGEATVGLGVGANALVGGSRRSVILQPLSVQGQKGLNIAAGIAGLTLHPTRGHY